MFRLLPCLLLLLALPACVTVSPEEDRGELSSDATTASLVAALESRGYRLVSRGFSTDPLVDATASEYYLEGNVGGYLQVYEFPTAERAEASLPDVRLASQSAGRQSVYQSGRLIVVYYGSDATLGLSRLLGQPVG